MRSEESRLSRRKVLQHAAGAATIVAAAQPASAQLSRAAATKDFHVQHGRIRQSVMGWCFLPMPADTLAKHAREIGLVAIEGDSGVQVVVNNGTITGAGGTAIDLGGGDDSVVVLFGSQVTGTIDGGAGTDSFTVNIQAYANDAQAIADAIAAQCPDASNCTINVNGVSYVVMNFEGAAGIHIILLTLATPKPQTICDGDVKVIKTVDGSYYDVYSGFTNDLPDGFWVGRVDLSKLPDTLKFQDKGEHNPGWYVGVTLVENNLIVLQAHSADGTLVGKSCKVPR